MTDERIVEALRDRFYHYQRRVKEESLKDPVHRLDDPRQYDGIEWPLLEGLIRRLLQSPKTGQDFIVELVHDIIWTQSFSDGNHRTAVAVLQGFAAHSDFVFGKEKDEFLASTTTFIDRSHSYTDLNRDPYTPAQRARFKEKQRLLVEEWVRENLPDQVGNLAMVGSHSLSAFSSLADN